MNTNVTSHTIPTMQKHTVLLIAVALLAFGVAMRLFPHLPNATPITAIAFAGSFYLGRRWVLALPVLALFLSDLVIGFYDWRIMASVYGSFALIGCWSYVSRRYGGILPVFLSVVGSSLSFFFITNGAVWLFSPWYEKSIAGLLYAYELGLPFLRNMALGDLIYSAVLFGVFELVRARIGIRAKVAIEFAKLRDALDPRLRGDAPLGPRLRGDAQKS